MLNNKYNITIIQGDDFGLTLTVKDVNNVEKDLTSYTARMHIRSTYKSNTIIENLSTSNGEIVIFGANGVISLEIPAVRTAAIPVSLNSSDRPPKEKYVYDLELIDSDSKVSKLIYGDAIIYGEVTR